MAQLMMTSNPVLNEKGFAGFATVGERMTLQGTVNKTGILLLCAMASAAWTWHLFMQSHSAADVLRDPVFRRCPWHRSTARRPCGD